MALMNGFPIILTMNTDPRSSSRKRSIRGFTLVEALVVIVILVSLAVLIVAVTRRVRESALMASNIQNLRTLGVALKGIESDDGALPLGYHWGTGVSWATRVVESQTYGNVLQDKIVLAPTVTRSIPPNFRHETIRLSSMRAQ